MATSSMRARHRKGLLAHDLRPVRAVVLATALLVSAILVGTLVWRRLYGHYESAALTTLPTANESGILLDSQSTQVTGLLRFKLAFSVLGGHSSAWLGVSLSDIGDIDRDGVCDLAAITGDPTAVSVFGQVMQGLRPTGSVVAISGRGGRTIWGYQPQSRSNVVTSVVGGVGDWDSDGHDDVGVGVSDKSIMSQLWGLFDDSSIVILSSTNGQGVRRFRCTAGYSLEAVGVLHLGGGERLAYSAPNLPPAPSQLWVVSRDRPRPEVALGLAEPEFGISVASDVDVDGDGEPDVAVGSPRCVRVNGVVSGRVHVFSAVNGRKLGVLDSGEFGSGFGESLISVGDRDGDGTREFIVGAPRAAGGTAVVISGAKLSVVDAMPSPPGLREFGGRVTALGDLNDDGVDDYAVCAWSGSLGGQENGITVICSGRTGQALGQLAGSACIYVGSSDGNAQRLAVGRPLYSQTGQGKCGRIDVYDVVME